MIDRRHFLVGLAGVASALAIPPAGLGRLGVRDAQAASLDPSVIELLRTSPYVYISPLKSDGQESVCHGEVWFGWLDGAAWTLVASERWKVRSVERGLDRARIWVGDHGRWKGKLTTNESFRRAPTFVARVSKAGDAAQVERLLEVYGQKYPKEINRWRKRMRVGFIDGSRTLLRYTPE